MKLNKYIQVACIALLLSGLAACSSTRGAGGAPVTSAGAMGEGANGAYAQGAGGADGGYGAGGGSGSGNSSGYGSMASCNVPKSAEQATFFAFDRSDVRSEDVAALQALAPKASNGGKLEVVGNTDDRGSREYNLALGTRRANAVAQVLEQAGVSKSQIVVNSNGAEYPIATGSSESSYQCNRRADVCQGQCQHG